MQTTAIELTRARAGSAPTGGCGRGSKVQHANGVVVLPLRRSSGRGGRIGTIESHQMPHNATERGDFERLSGNRRGTVVESSYHRDILGIELRMKRGIIS
jgi:hypothetical protein